MILQQQQKTKQQKIQHLTETATQEHTYVAPVETVEVAPAKPQLLQQRQLQACKEWIAQKESGGSYTATNGRYIGRYQLDVSYLNGDYSAANQERSRTICNISLWFWMLLKHSG